MTREPASFQDMLLRPGLIGRLHALSVRVFGGELRESARDDIVQGALLSAWERRASFRGTSEAEFVGWFLSIVRRRALDEARRRQRAPLLLGEEILAELSMEANGATVHASDAERRRSLELGLARLGKVERAVIELIFRYGLPTGEAGALLGMELAAARMAQLRAVRKLKRFMVLRASL